MRRNLTRSLSRVLLILAIALPGCMGSFDPTQRFSDQVHQMNDETRWARVDLASENVTPEYRATFLASHRRWGSDIQIADAETTNIVINDDDTASSTVRISWYDELTMEAHATIVDQRFVYRDETYLLNEEAIRGGDPTLLDLPEEIPEEEAEETSGDEAALDAEIDFNPST